MWGTAEELFARDNEDSQMSEMGSRYENTRKWGTKGLCSLPSHEPMRPRLVLFKKINAASKNSCAKTVAFTSSKSIL